jgi:hypothetical protein
MVTRSRLQTDAPIEPGFGLGGIRLGRPIQELRPLLEESFLIRGDEELWYWMSSPWEVRYTLGPVEIGVDVRSGRIFKLTAREGYRGTLFDRIRVGMIVADVMALDQRVAYDEVEALLTVRGCTGITLDVAALDPDLRDVPMLRITAISVLDHEALADAPVAGGV